MWYMAAATLPAGMVGKSRICRPFLAICMWIFPCDALERTNIGEDAKRVFLWFLVSWLYETKI